MVLPNTGVFCTVYDYAVKQILVRATGIQKENNKSRHLLKTSMKPEGGVGGGGSELYNHDG